MLSKGELAKMVADRLGLTQKNVSSILETYSDIICEELIAGKPVMVTKVATFIPKTLHERNCYNIQQKTVLRLPERTKIKCCVNRSLQDRFRDQNESI